MTGEAATPTIEAGGFQSLDEHSLYCQTVLTTSFWDLGTLCTGPAHEAKPIFWRKISLSGT